MRGAGAGWQRLQLISGCCVRVPLRRQCVHGADPIGQWTWTCTESCLFNDEQAPSFVLPRPAVPYRNTFALPDSMSGAGAGRGCCSLLLLYWTVYGRGLRLPLRRQVACVELDQQNSRC